MADSDQYNDEYQFADLDSMEPSEVVEEEPSVKESSEELTKPNKKTYFEPQHLKRNALIAVGGLIFLIIIYKWLSSGSAPKKMVEPTPTPIPIQAIKPTASPTPAAPELSQEKAQSVVDNQLTQKIAAIELSEQNMRTDISTINEQLAMMTNNLNAMSTKITELSGIVANLSQKIDQEVKVIEQKAAVQRPIQRTYYPRHHTHGEYHKYYLQAVIPGRAWLIATTGSTLTVREGTMIPGYGIVKLIDPNQGRVLTSSGHIIKFSQNDS